MELKGKFNFKGFFKSPFFFLIILLVLTLTFCYFIKIKSVNYDLTVYEKELINYFKEIALKSEYDDNPEKVIKWNEPMMLFIVKEAEFKSQISVIEKTIDKINQLATDGFRIAITNNILESNSVLYMCNKERVAELDPYFYRILNEGIDYKISGLAYSEFNNTTFIIDKSLIFINSEESIDIQEATILEEITQSIGLAFDSEKYSNSVFYKNKAGLDTLIKEYSVIDEDIVRLLYHPKMKPGIDSTQVEQLIKKYLNLKKTRFN